MNNRTLKFVGTLRNWSAIVTIGTTSIFAGCDPSYRQIVQQADNAFPKLIEHSIQPTEPNSLNVVNFSAIVDSKGREHPDFFVDVLALNDDGSKRTEQRIEADCFPNGEIWNCSAQQRLGSGKYKVQWVVFFDFQGGMVNGNRTFITFPSSDELLTVLYAGQGSVPGPVEYRNCTTTTAPTVLTPTIEAPLGGATCVGQPIGNRASVSFLFGDVSEACGSAAYQIEIHKLDSDCNQVLWTGPGTGLSDFGRCWIADQNFHEHAETLHQNTRYEWRVRANSRSNVIGAGPFSNFQTFITGGLPAAPVFTSPERDGIISMGAATGKAIHVEWQPESVCGDGQSFVIRVIEDDELIATARGVGNKTDGVFVRRGHSYRLELKVSTIWGDSPQVLLQFTTQ
ncbi:MAG: hypothetical protein HPY82_10310 [Gammaproteobacteria bacterium]|nr:hypothetical protein [Gammaproteobacteria bacterium]